MAGGVFVEWRASGSDSDLECVYTGLALLRRETKTCVRVCMYDCHCNAKYSDSDSDFDVGLRWLAALRRGTRTCTCML
jgi:hypothetical protein